MLVGIAEAIMVDLPAGVVDWKIVMQKDHVGCVQLWWEDGKMEERVLESAEIDTAAEMMKFVQFRPGRKVER